jgi:hypothetical protein
LAFWRFSGQSLIPIIRFGRLIPGHQAAKSFNEQPFHDSGMEFLSAFLEIPPSLPHSFLAEYQLELPINRENSYQTCGQ